MAGISMCINSENQVSVVERVMSELAGKRFNLLVQTHTRLNGDTQAEVKIIEKELKYCGRVLAGGYKINGLQIVIPFLPAVSFAWDLNTERVVIEFGPSEIVLCRIFSKSDRRKVLRVTNGPI